MRDEIHEWAKLQDWEHIQAVIGLGMTDDKEFVDTVFRCKPGVNIFLFDPESEKGNPEERVFVNSDLQELRGDIIDHIKLIGNFAFARDPRFKGGVEKEVLDVVNEARQYFVTMQHTARFHAKDWADVGFKVLPKIVDKPLFNFFPETFKGKPGVVVGAGPSLDKAIPALKEIQDRVVIFSANSAAIPLYEAGIQPHFIAAIEKKGLSIEPLLNHPVTKKAYVVPGIHAYPPVYDVDCRDMFPAIQMVGPIGQWLCPMFKIDPVHTGGSVSTVCYRLADKLGCSPIILVGCDCAQGPDNSGVYADNVAHKTDGYKGIDTVKVTAYGGIGFVQAPQVLNTYRYWFENRTEEKRAVLINSSVGGAQINGWIEKELKDVELGDAFDVFEAIDEIKESVPRLHPEPIIKGLEEQINESSKFAKWSREALKAATEFDRTLKLISTTKHKFNIVMSSSVSSIDEYKSLPNEAQIKAAIEKVSRVNALHYEYKNKIREVIKGLKNET